MPDALIVLAAVLANLVGLAWIALAMEPHWEQVRSDPLHAGRAAMLRVLGASAIAGSALLCLWADHATMAWLVWTMALTAAAIVLAFALAWRPRLLAPLLAWVGGPRRG
ncbi:MAG TPA: DUF3325 domain-containing protein [Variovorax sp.]|nr:DUF3325 domain-containing protein [Variovorax sp.]